MSITNVKRKTIEYGDVVCIWSNRESVNWIKLEKNKTFHNKFGVFKHEDFVSKPFGSKIIANKGGNGYVYVLQPTPELWTRSITHRTQILYEVDISMILFYLDIKPGSVVYESGTGSGSLSTAIARTIFPNGHLYTFEINAERVEKAKCELIDWCYNESCLYRFFLNPFSFFSFFE